MALIGESLRGRRVLVTQSLDFMGPALCAAFAEHGAEVVADEQPLDAPDAAEAAVARATAGGRPLDVLIANLAIPAPSTPATAVTDEEWRTVFAHLVDPLPRLVDGHHGHTCGDRITHMHWLEKACVLTHIGRTRPGQTGADQGRPQAGRERTIQVLKRVPAANS